MNYGIRPLFSLFFVTFLFLHFPTAFAHSDPGYSHKGTPDEFKPNWMSELPGSTRLKELSLPGTHDTMARHGGDMIQTQSLELREQLDAGIRVLDIRCRRVKERFQIYHGKSDQKANFDDVLLGVTEFLKDNPSEIVFMRVKEEENPIKSTKSFNDIFAEYYIDDRFNQYFYQVRSKQDNPTVEETRGKIVILQNFSDSKDYGLDYARFKIQDDSDVHTQRRLFDKWDAVKSQFQSANGRQTHEYYVNYLSGSGYSGAFVFPYFVASGHSSPQTGAPRLTSGIRTSDLSKHPDFPRKDCTVSRKVCSVLYEGTNILARTYLTTNSSEIKYVGMVFADFPGAGLIHAIIKLNFSAP